MKRSQVLALTIGYILAFSCCACKKSATQSAENPAAENQAAETSTHFKLPDYKGGEVDLSAYAGKPVLLMFFTETCPYCRKAAPFIKRISDRYASKGLSAIGICVEDAAAPAAGFAKSFGLTFPIAYKGRDVSVRYKTQGVPYIFLLTKKHVIHNVWAGYDESFDKDIVSGIEEIIQ